jgi:hypothetical protein
MVPCHCPEAGNCDRRPMRRSGRSVGAAGQSKKADGPCRAIEIVALEGQLCAACRTRPIATASATQKASGRFRTAAKPPRRQASSCTKPAASIGSRLSVLLRNPFTAGELNWSAGSLLDSHRMPHLRGHLLHGVGELALGKLLVGKIEYHQNDGSGSQCLHERPPESGWRIEASRRVRIGTPAARDAGGGGLSRKMPGARRGRKTGRPLEAALIPDLPSAPQVLDNSVFVHFLTHTSRFGGVAH